MSLTTSATLTPWSPPDQICAAQSTPALRQNVPAGPAGRSPEAAAVFQATAEKVSMTPTFTPAPRSPAACQAAALVSPT